MWHIICHELSSADMLTVTTGNRKLPQNMIFVLQFSIRIKRVLNNTLNFWQMVPECMCHDVFSDLLLSFNLCCQIWEEQDFWCCRFAVLCNRFQYLVFDNRHLPGYKADFNSITFAHAKLGILNKRPLKMGNHCNCITMADFTDLFNQPSSVMIRKIISNSNQARFK